MGLGSSAGYALEPHLCCWVFEDLEDEFCSHQQVVKRDKGAELSEVVGGNSVAEGNLSSPKVDSGNPIIDDALPLPKAAQLQVFVPPPISNLSRGLIARTNISFVPPDGFCRSFSGLESFSNEGRDSDSNDSFSANYTIVD